MVFSRLYCQNSCLPKRNVFQRGYRLPSNTHFDVRCSMFFALSFCSAKQEAQSRATAEIRQGIEATKQRLTDELKKQYEEQLEEMKDQVRARGFCRRRHDNVVERKFADTSAKYRIAILSFCRLGTFPREKKKYKPPRGTLRVFACRTTSECTLIMAK